MKLDCKNGDRGQLFDANGNEIEDCLRADTETGETEVFERGEDGKIIFTPTINMAKTKVVKFPAPLRWEPNPDFRG